MSEPSLNPQNSISNPAKLFSIDFGTLRSEALRSQAIPSFASPPIPKGGAAPLEVPKQQQTFQRKTNRAP